MLGILLAHCHLTENEIEKEIHCMHQQNGSYTDDDDLIIDCFLKKHITVNTITEETMQTMRIELTNFMYGCGDIQTTRLVRQRTGDNIASGSSEKGKDVDMLDVGIVGIEDENITTERAHEIVGAMRVSLEDDSHEKTKQHPTTARQVLSALKINRQMMTHCITTENEPKNVVQANVNAQECNYFCFVSKMDPKGSTPQDILDVIYCLDMMQKYYMSCKKTSRDGDHLFDVPKALPNQAKTITKNGATFHKIYKSGEAITVPILNMKLFVEQASTGGEMPMVMFFMFLVVAVPITFDFVDAIYRSCNRAVFGLKEKIVCEDMKSLWTKIAYKHQTFSGIANKNLDTIMKIQFNDIFDPDSYNAFWKLFRIPRCIQQARSHMHMWAMDDITNRSKISVDIANTLINIRFSNIDNVWNRNCSTLETDTLFVNISNFCASEFSTEFDLYKNRVRDYKEASKSKKNGTSAENDMTDDELGGGGENTMEMPVFDPPLIFSTFTLIDWEHEETRELLCSICVCDTVDTSADSVRLLVEHMSKYPDSIQMHGFPVTNMVAYVDNTMLLPHSNTYISMDEWLVENKECALPDQMTISILVMMHQKTICHTSIFANMVSEQDTMSRNILTLSDLRNSFLSDNIHTGSMMYRKAVVIRDKQMHSVCSGKNNTRRSHAIQYYLMGTVYPLAYANARSDTGMYGGKDRIATVMNDIGEFQLVNSGYLSNVAAGFQKVYSHFLKCDENSHFGWHLDRYKGMLQNTIHLWKASIDHMNQNFRLKSNNVELFFRLQQSEIGFRLCYLVNSIGPAPNGIGLPNYIKNFGGSLMRKSKRTNSQFEVRNSKEWGVGADNTMAKFLEAQHPRNNDCPNSIDLSIYANAEDWRGTTEAGTWHAYTITRIGNGKSPNPPGELPIPIYCNEIPAHDSRSGGVNLVGKICSLLPRNTEVDQAGKRSYTVKNEKTGQFEKATQDVCWYIEPLSLAQNTESDNQLEQTLTLVCTTVPAGSVDTEDVDITSTVSFKSVGHNDMGDTSKYTATKNDKIVSMCKRIWSHDVRAVCVSVSGAQWRGYFPDSKAGVETPVFDIIANYVYMHTSIQTQDAKLSSQRGRETQKAQARLPPTALYLHSANALLHRNIQHMTWSDIVYTASINWIVDPSPLELIPVFMGSMIENTFDWGFWLILAILADFFKTPYMDIESVNKIFCNENQKLSTRKSAKMKKWLDEYGVNKKSSNENRSGDLLFVSDISDAMERSAIYISSKWNTEMSISSSPLACNLPTQQNFQGASAGNSAKDSVVGPSGVSWKMSEHIANVLFTKYQKHLRSACNISSVESLAIMIYRYIDSPVIYPKFAKAPCGVGFQSWNSILTSLNCEITEMKEVQHEDSANFVDGSSGDVNHLLSQNNYSYSISPWTIVNREGSVYSFGVEPRLLILARSIIAHRPLVSQLSVQCIFDHFVNETIQHRIPSTLYPYATIFTGLPDPDSLGLSLQVQDVQKVYLTKPTTMLRALPCTCVKEMSGTSISGVISGSMVEDIAVLNKFTRLATILNIPVNALHMEELTPPTLPFFVWIYMETVKKPENIQTDTFEAETCQYQKTALFIDDETQTFTKCVSYSLFPHNSTHMKEYEELITTENIKVWHSMPVSLLDAVMPSNHSFIRYAPIYNRHGILIHIEYVGFFVLKKWKQDLIKIVVPTKIASSDQFFNPNTMSYIAVTEAIDIQENSSYMKMVQNVSSSDLESVVNHNSNAFISKKTWPQILDVFTSIKKNCITLSSRDVQNSIVGVGTVLFLDIHHPALPSDITKNLKFSKCNNKSIAKTEPGNKSSVYGVYPNKFNELCTNSDDFYPVVQCMLLYDMPESIVQYNTYSNMESQVWVGIRQVINWNTKHKYTTRYITIPTKALICVEKLMVIEKSLAIFESCLI